MDLELLQTPFIQRAFIGALILSLLTSLWGVFVVLRKQAYLSDAISHASILGIAIGLYFGVFPLYFAILIAVIFAVVLTYLKERSKQTNDTLIGIVYSLFFALGLIIISRTSGVKIDLDSYLFGSLFGISQDELILLSSLLLTSIVFLLKYYKQVLYSTFDPENAFLQGINVRRNDYLINIFLSITVIAAIKAVGLIMLSALLLAPAATARNLADRFSQVIPMAALISVVGSLCGLVLSLSFNLPAGASIVVVLSLIFLLSNLFFAYSHR